MQLINFWNFAKENNLSNIAYALSFKILSQSRLTSENLNIVLKLQHIYIIKIMKKQING